MSGEVAELGLQSLDIGNKLGRVDLDLLGWRLGLLSFHRVDKSQDESGV